MPSDRLNLPTIETSLDRSAAVLAAVDAQLRRQHASIYRSCGAREQTPGWLFDRAFERACAATTRDGALDWVRRLSRVHAALGFDAGARPAAPGADAPPAPAPAFARRSRTRGSRSVRWPGRAGEAGARAAQAGFAAPASAKREAATLANDSYLAALWVDAHANFAATCCHVDVGECGPISTSFGAPCVRITTSISSLPSLATQFQDMLYGRDPECPQLRAFLRLVLRSTQVGTRGWETTVAECTKHGASCQLLQHTIVAFLTGMHRHVHPAARAGWRERIHSIGTIASIVSKGTNAMALLAPNVAKEALRVYASALLCLLPATQAALAQSGYALGSLTGAADVQLAERAVVRGADRERRGGCLSRAVHPDGAAPALAERQLASRCTRRSRKRNGRKRLTLSPWLRARGRRRGPRPGQPTAPPTYSAWLGRRCRAPRQPALLALNEARRGAGSCTCCPSGSTAPRRRRRRRRRRPAAPRRVAVWSAAPPPLPKC